MAFLDAIVAMLSSPLMQRGLMVAVLVGISVPVMGTYLAQRRLALFGHGIGARRPDGRGHGLAGRQRRRGHAARPAGHTGRSDPAVIGAVLIEIVREKGRTSGDVALALLFYGGIAGGVLLNGLAGGTSANLTDYLVGSISTVTVPDVWLTAGLALLILGIRLGLRPALFALCHDEEFARSTGLPTRALNILMAGLAALTVSVSMRAVGVLLVSALMIVPVAVAQLSARSFGATISTAMIIGATVCVTGLSITYFHRLSPGATIVVLATRLYALVAIVRPLLRRPQRPRDPHLDAEDDVRLREGA